MKKRYSEHKTACFACITPYQLMGAISIVQAQNIDADLYLFGLFNEYEIIAAKLTDYNIFKRVIPVSYERLRNTSKMSSFYQLLHIDKTLEYFLPFDVVYDKYYSTCNARGVMMLYYALIKRNPQMVKVYYEDGLGTYVNGLLILKKTTMRKISEFILGFTPSKNNYETLMACYPLLLELPKSNPSFCVETMPTLNWTYENLMMLNNVFSINRALNIDERVIIFDIVRKSSNPSISSLMDKCISSILNICSSKNVICKPHPRSEKNTNLNINYFNQLSVPVEIIYASMTDLENRVLIGNLSTALFSPKMMFGLEPYVISLHKIVWYSKGKLCNLFDKCCSMYNRKEKVFAPESLTELNYLLEQIKKEINL